MSNNNLGLEVGPHTTHLHLADRLDPPTPDEAFLRSDQRAALEILTHERQNPCSPTIEVVYMDGVEQKVTVVNMLLNAHVRWGKFEVMMADFRRFAEEYPGTRGLYLAHTVNLVRNARAKFDRREATRPSGIRLSSGEFHGEQKDDTNVGMLFATVQSMYGPKGIRFPQDYFGYIAADEVHHSKAPTHEALIKGYYRPIVRAGMTATPNRLDQLDITDIYGQPVVDVPLAEGFVYRRVREMVYKAILEPSIRDKVEDGQAGTALLNRMTRSLEYNLSEMILRHEDEIATEGITNPRVIYYAQSISQAHDIAALLDKEVVVIHSEQSDAANQAALETFNSGLVNRIVSVNMLNEGLDIWQPTHLAFFRSTDSENIFIQQLGRGLEPVPDDSPLRIHDFVANGKRLEFIYKLIHGITSYAKNAKEYRQQVRRQLPDGASEVAHREVAKGFGAEFELDEELLKVMQAVADQQQYMEKRRQWDEVSEFDARAYLVCRPQTESKLIKTKIEEASKRGEGPSIRALTAAAGETFNQMLETTDRSSILNSIEDLNDINFPDVIILMVKDLILRHPGAVNNMYASPQGPVFLSKHLNLLQDFGLRLNMSLSGDMVLVTGRGGNQFALMPGVETSKAIGKHFNRGWSVKFEEVTGATTDTFYSEQEAEQSNEIGAKLLEVLWALANARDELQTAGVLHDSYPFYESRSVNEVGQILDRFTGQDDPAVEWAEYRNTRDRIKHHSHYVNMMKRSMELMSETDREGAYANLLKGVSLIWLDTARFKSYRLKYDKRAKRLRIMDRDTHSTSTPPEIEIDFSANRITTLAAPQHRNLGLPYESPEVSIEAIFNDLIRSKLSRTGSAPFGQPNSVSQEHDSAYAKEWLDGFMAKVEAAQHYIDNDSLHEMDAFNDEIIGKLVEFPSKSGGRPGFTRGVVSKVDYQAGSIEVVSGVGLKGKPIKLTTSTLKVFRKGKNGSYISTAQSRSLAIFRTNRI